MIAALESRDWSIFRRMALYLLSIQPEAPIELVAPRLIDRVAFNDVNLRHEYVGLLRCCFRRLAKGDQERILSYVEEGPQYLEGSRARYKEKTGEEMSPEHAAQLVQRWQRDRLAPIADSLPDRWKSRYMQYPAGFARDSFAEALEMLPVRG
jgi:hypothetical protein